MLFLAKNYNMEWLISITTLIYSASYSFLTWSLQTEPRTRCSLRQVGLEDVFLEEKCHIILLYFNQDLHESAQKWAFNTLQNEIYYAWCGPCLY